MSDDQQNHFYFHNPFQESHYGTSFSFSSNTNNSISSISTTPQGFDPNSSYMSFTDCLHESTSDQYNAFERAFGLSPPNSSEVINLQVKDEGKSVGASVEIPVTPNSSVLSSSSEAGDDEGKKDITQKESDDGEEISKKVNKSKKKGEKKEREPRFAFMTKSEVDHLEDGYRWRKYGQKAVKNSPFPRSYYRCTTQKCSVKKRVERSYQDPSIVITTYEGQHNHPIPTTIRGHVAGILPNSMYSASPPTSVYNNSYNNIYGGMSTMSSYYPQQSTSSINSSNNTLTPFQQLQLNDYGLLQDMVPSSMIFKQEQ